MQFYFATSNCILFGPGTITAVPNIAVSLGQRPFIVISSKERAPSLLDGLSATGLSSTYYQAKREPDLASVNLAMRYAKEADCDMVIAIGGGSTLDTGKAVAALLTNPGQLLDYLEIIGKGLPLKKPAAPFIAIPTTSGTGSEVTRNAVISVPEQHLKVSLRSPYLLPSYSVIDPMLTYSLPPAVTAFTSLDALTQVIEPFVCNATNPLTDTFCRDGISRAAYATKKAYHHGQDADAREQMSLISLYGGMALANARLGAVHGLASPLGGMIPAPHGAICARLLPIVMEKNLKALQARQPESPALGRYWEISRLLTGNQSADPSDGATWVQSLCDELNIRPLAEFGLQPDIFPEIISQSRNASSMKGNPVILTNSELQEILERAI